MGYPMGWSHDELIMFLSACLAFWMLPRSGLRLRKKTSSCCCPAHSPRTHSLFTCRGRRRDVERKREHASLDVLRKRLFSMMILYSSLPSSMMWRSASSDGMLARMALRHTGSPS
ncbi:hypothetical protein EYF80_013478 [Liparis tanakae]|uniref:Uncharacterized protein n=1 Tax=Liparis tanakae TaxID=230148 RepID=A0A4Z2IE26_9TELE|nr:hypothetical protein EYF80_013478 [Liparis tanakae]